MFSVYRKVVIITGTRTGIGKALAKGFTTAGAIVYPIERKTCDIFKQEERKKFIENIVKEHKKIDVLINNAGVTEGKVMETNLLIIKDLCKEVSEYMDGGSIINITSIASLFGMGGNLEYGMAKGGLRILTKCLAIDLSPIRVNNLCPGYVRTKMTEKSYNDKLKRFEREQRIIMKRFADPEELVGPALFLASDASSYITGTDIIVDGGFSAKGI